MDEQTPLEKRKASIIKKYGSWEAYKEKQAAHGSDGGKKSGNRPFRNKEFARQAGKKGAESRYGKNT